MSRAQDFGFPDRTLPAGRTGREAREHGQREREGSRDWDAVEATGDGRIQGSHAG